MVVDATQGGFHDVAVSHGATGCASDEVECFAVGGEAGLRFPGGGVDGVADVDAFGPATGGALGEIDVARAFGVAVAAGGVEHPSAVGGDALCALVEVGVDVVDGLHGSPLCVGVVAREDVEVLVGLVVVDSCDH